jgi:hypothetical protein
MEAKADSDPVGLFGSRAIVDVDSRIQCQSRLASGLHRSRAFKTEAFYSLSAISVLSSDPNLLH